MVGILTLLSKMLGFSREMLTIRFLGLGALSDIFIVAFKIPNFLRRIFAEGALSAAFTPSLVKLMQPNVPEGRQRSFNLMTLAFFFFQGMLIVLCALMWWKSHYCIWLFGSGFSVEQLAIGGRYLRILLPLILCISSSALIAGALGAVHHFFIPSMSSIILNIFFIGSLLLCLYYNFSVEVLCFGIVIGSLAQLLAHIGAYFFNGLRFGIPNKQAVTDFKPIMRNFLGCLSGVGIVELNLLIDTQVASFLPAGSISLITYSYQFVGIPLSMFAVAFSTILLPHLSRVAHYAPARLVFYFFEALKLVCWIILPATIFLIGTSHELFAALLFGGRATTDQIWCGSWILTIFASALVFFSINKILKSIYYALEHPQIPAYVSIISVLVNLAGNLASILLLSTGAIFGIALSSVIAEVVQTACLIYILVQRFGFHVYGKHFGVFTQRMLLQASCVGGLVIVCYHGIKRAASMYQIHSFVTQPFGFWLLSIPLGMIGMLLLLITRERFKIRLYFLQK